MSAESHPPDPRIKAFGTLLRAHRERRNLAQDRLSQWAGLGRNAVGRLERGEREPGTVDVVLALADTLNLRGLVRKEFFATAGFLPEPDPLHDPQKVENLVQNFYDKVHEFPAFVYDAYYDLHSVNSYMLPLFRVEPKQVKHMLKSPQARNILYQLFQSSDPTRHTTPEAHDRWFHSTVNTLYRFRMNMLGKTHTERYQEIIAALKESENRDLFLDLWRQIEMPSFQPESRALPAQVGPFTTNSGLTLVFITVHAQMGIEQQRIAPDYTFHYYVPANAETGKNLKTLRENYPYKTYGLDDDEDEGGE